MVKKLLSVSFLFLLLTNVYSQKLIKTNPLMNLKWENETHVIKCSEFHITKPLREIVAEHPITENRYYAFSEYPDKENMPVQKFIYTVEKDGNKYGNDPSIIQKSFGKIIK